MKTHSHYTFSPLSLTPPAMPCVVLECRLRPHPVTGKDTLTYEVYPVLGLVSRTAHEYQKEYAEQAPAVLGGVDHQSVTQVGYKYQSSADVISAVVLHPQDGPILAEGLFAGDTSRTLRYALQGADRETILQGAERWLKSQKDAAIPAVCFGASD